MGDPAISQEQAHRVFLSSVSRSRLSRSQCSGGTWAVRCRSWFLRHGANDGFALLFKAIFLIAAALAIGISTRFLDIEGEQHGEYYSLILFATLGMMFIACSYDLISLYISLD